MFLVVKNVILVKAMPIIVLYVLPLDNKLHLAVHVLQDKLLSILNVILVITDVLNVLEQLIIVQNVHPVESIPLTVVVKTDIMTIWLTQLVNHVNQFVKLVLVVVVVQVVLIVELIALLNVLVQPELMKKLNTVIVILVMTNVKPVEVLIQIV